MELICDSPVGLPVYLPFLLSFDYSAHASRFNFKLSHIYSAVRCPGGFTLCFCSNDSPVGLPVYLLILLSFYATIVPTLPVLTSNS